MLKSISQDRAVVYHKGILASPTLKQEILVFVTQIRSECTESIMKMRLLTLYLKELMAFTVLLLAVPAMSQETTKPDLRVITFGAGPIDGAYYEVVNEICTRFNHNPIEGYRCSTDPTPGSLYNLAALRRGTLDFALAQSDLHRALYRMSNYEASASKPFELRSVMSVYPEHFT